MAITLVTFLPAWSRAVAVAAALLSMPLHAAPDLAQQVAALVKEQGLHGAVWTTLDAQGAAGSSDVRTGKPMRVDDRVHVGSIAKTVLAAGILRLASERRLSLDTPVATLLPGMPFDNPWRASDPVRIRHLLDHTAGLDDAHLRQVFSMEARADTPLAAAFSEGSGLLRIRHRPGARFSYSNMGYTLLGMVVEAVTRQRYERYLDAHLLAPLGMHDSTFAFVSQAGDARLAMGHFENGATHAAVPTWIRPAGQFTTTAADMGRLARFLMGDGTVAGKPFIDPALLQQMGEPAGTEAVLAGLRVGYGLGLRRIDRHGALAKCHGGSTIGFRAMLCLFPATRQGFFIAFNTDSETADHARFDGLFIRSLQRAVPVAVPVPALVSGTAAPFDPRAWQGFYIPSPVRFETMRLVDTAFNFVHVSADGEGLRLQPFQSGPVELRHLGGSLFRAPGKLLASHALLVSTEGTRMINSGTQRYEQVSLLRLAALWTSMAAGVLGLGCIAAMGCMRLARRRMALRDPLLAPFAGTLALLLPVPFLYRQSFLQLGDLTLASGLLAAVTAALPVTMLVGLAMALRNRAIERAAALAMLAVLQLAVLLAAWELLPLRLWS
jgi:CubicO group peptidase (beta-lactamase class C family)